MKLEKTIYDTMVANNIPMGHWQSDLYVPVNPVTTALIAEHEATYGEKITKSVFKHNISGAPWYDLSFAYLPYWQIKKLQATAN